MTPSIQPPTFTKYERARILGARALQLAMNAPLLIKLSVEDLEKINYDVLKIAEVELDSGVLPISINKPFPERKEGKLKRDVAPKIIDEKKENTEESEEEKIEEEGEIMELANPEDEANEEVEEDASESYGE
jgi:DNA-directed RNA polymerase subunit K/omega